MKTFDQLCVRVLGTVLGEFGYAYRDTHVRPRGVAVEFAKGDHRLFAVCEGDVVYLDLILRSERKPIYRVSLNQWLWHRGVRSVAERRPCSEQLGFLSEHLRLYGESVLKCDDLAIDSRYCFPMSGSEYRDYILFQTGKDLTTTRKEDGIDDRQ